MKHDTVKTAQLVNMQITFLDIECSETSNLELNNYISLVSLRCRAFDIMQLFCLNIWS